MLWIYLGLVLDMSHTIIAWLTSSQTIGFIWARQKHTKKGGAVIFDLLHPKQLDSFGSKTTTQQTEWKKAYSFLLSFSFSPIIGLLRPKQLGSFGPMVSEKNKEK